MGHQRLQPATRTLWLHVHMLDQGVLLLEISKTDKTSRTTPSCRDGETEAQRRKIEDSQLVVAEPRPLPSPSQGPGSQGTAIKACLQPH